VLVKTLLTTLLAPLQILAGFEAHPLPLSGTSNTNSADFAMALSLAADLYDAFNNQRARCPVGAFPRLDGRPASFGLDGEQHSSWAGAELVNSRDTHSRGAVAAPRQS
jgi:hypothetical protein